MANPFIKRIWQGLDVRITWIALARIQNSFLSKALTTLSITALILGNASTTLNQIGIDSSTARLIFVGSGIFLAGYVAYATFAPSEFRQAGEIDEIVSRMTILTSWQFFSSRRNLAKELLSRSKARKCLLPPEGTIKFIDDQTESTKDLNEIDKWKEAAPGMYHADLQLRQHDLPVARLAVGLLLAVGLVLLMFPTMHNVIKTIESLG